MLNSLRAVIETTCPETYFLAPGYYSFSGIFLPFRENEIGRKTGTVKKSPNSYKNVYTGSL
jgi:hypothetical protein